MSRQEIVLFNLNNPLLMDSIKGCNVVGEGRHLGVTSILYAINVKGFEDAKNVAKFVTQCDDQELVLYLNNQYSAWFLGECSEVYKGSFRQVDVNTVQDGGDYTFIEETHTYYRISR